MNTGAVIDAHSLARTLREPATDTTSWAMEDAQLTVGEGPCVGRLPAGHHDHHRGLQRRPPVAALRRRAHRGRLRPGGGRGASGARHPIRLQGPVVGSLDVHHSDTLQRNAGQVRALVRFGRVAETMVTGVGVEDLHSSRSTAQLEYAIAHRAPMERGVGYLMAREGLAEHEAFARSRSAARSARRTIGQVARTLTTSGRLPGEQS